MRRARLLLALLCLGGVPPIVDAQVSMDAGPTATVDAPPFVEIPAPSAGTVARFSISATEVTVEHFAAFVKATGYRTKAEQDEAARTWLEPGYAREPRQPVTYVTPRDAAAYCSWVGGRLPTDEEWVFAARAGAATRHFWGDEIDPAYLWYRPNADDRPRMVGTKRPNAFALYDIEGNVWEWTVPNEPLTDQTLASRRGGSWVSCEDREPAPGEDSSPLIAIDVRYKVPLGLHHRYDDIGFRCAKPVQ